MAPRSEQSRQRVAAAASLLQDLWGDGLPPGHAPWQRIAADVLDIDDAHGEQTGVAVQGDELPLAVMAEALTYVPAGASLHAMLPPSLLERIRQAAAVRDPDARTLTVGARLLSAAIRATGCRWAGVYLDRGDDAELESSLGMTPWEQLERCRVWLPGDGALCKALKFGVTARGVIPVPVQGGGWGGDPELVSAPCVAVPFPGSAPGARAVGALLLVFPAEGDPDPLEIGAAVAPLVAEAEHLHVSDQR